MKYEKVIIKQTPDALAAAMGLNKHNRSKMPGTADHLQVAQGEDGRYITGIDEDAYEVNMIEDPERKAEVRKQIKELRESLEKQLGGRDLSGTSTFWETFIMNISSDGDLTLSRHRPMDVIKYHALIANGYVAPDFESSSHPAFLSCKYYCHIEEKVNAAETSTQKIRHKATSELLRISEVPEKMALIGQYLEGDKYKFGMSPDTLYAMLSQFIANPNEPDNLGKFLKAVEMPVEDMQYKVTIDRAIKKKVIKYNSGLYQRGQVTLGRNPGELYDNLKKPDFATEFLSIKEEVDSL